MVLKVQEDLPAVAARRHIDLGASRVVVEALGAGVDALRRVDRVEVDLVADEDGVVERPVLVARLNLQPRALVAVGFERYTHGVLVHLEAKGGIDEGK